MRMSPEGRALLKRREGVRLKAYRDSVGVWTIGVGHTTAAGLPAVTPDLVITPAECDLILARDLPRYERPVENAVKVPLRQNEFDALVSCCFNVGPKFASSTVIRKLNAGDRAGAAHAFLMWNKPPEIMGRRRDEMRQFSEDAARPAALRQGAATARKTAKTQTKQAAATAAAATATQAGHGTPAAHHLGAGTIICIGLAVAVIAGALAWKARQHFAWGKALEDASNEGDHGL
jgi:lysozyme